MSSLQKFNHLPGAWERRRAIFSTKAPMLIRKDASTRISLIDELILFFSDAEKYKGKP